jgi:carboxymethylenebutenolidase
VVAVPEIFHDLEAPGCEIAYDAAGADRGNADKIGRPVKAYDDDARTVIRFLRTHPSCTGKIGSIGICIGGHLSFRASMNPEVLAGVCFYATDIHKGSLGQGGDDTLTRINDLKAEMLMIWGRQDPHVPTEGRALIQKAMNDAQVNFTWHEFNGAHAFLRDEGPRYDPALALTCYRLAVDLFKRKLGEGDTSSSQAGGGETRH